MGVSEVRLRPLAEDDLVERARYYRSKGGIDLGVRFFDSAMRAVRGIELAPGAGSLRIGELCEVPGLRSSRVAGFPCGWFYFDRATHVDVVRLLAYAQDLNSILGERREGS